MSLNVTASDRTAQPNPLSVALLAVRQVAAYFIASPMAMAGVAFVLIAALLSIRVG